MITNLTDLRKAITRRHNYQHPTPKTKPTGRRVILMQTGRTRVGKRTIPAGSIGYLRWIDKRGRLIVDFGPGLLIVVPADSPMIKVPGEG